MFLLSLFHYQVFRNSYFVLYSLLCSNGCMGCGGAAVRALVSYTNGSSSILSKGKNQNIGRSPVNPAVNGYLVLLGPGKVKAVGRDAGHIILLRAEAAESRHALIVLGPTSLHGSGRIFTLYLNGCMKSLFTQMQHLFNDRRRRMTNELIAAELKIRLY